MPVTVGRPELGQRATLIAAVASTTMAVLVSPVVPVARAVADCAAGTYDEIDAFHDAAVQDASPTPFAGEQGFAGADFDVGESARRVKLLAGLGKG